MELPHTVVEGIRQPDWDALPESSDTEVVRAATDHWLGALLQDVPGLCRVRRSGVTVVGCAGEREALMLAESAARFRDRLLLELPTVAREPVGGLVVLQLPNEAYYRYLSRWYGEGASARSAGVSLRIRRPHLVLAHVAIQLGLMGEGGTRARGGDPTNW